MHFFTVVLIAEPQVGRVQQQVSQLMLPYHECDGEICLNGHAAQHHWDWFRIGGRWDRRLFEREPAPCDFNDACRAGFNFEDHHELLANNSRPVSELAEDFTCAAIVTPDGEWHEGGWFFKENSPEETAWYTQMRRLLAINNECLAVGVDCHI